MLRVCVLLTVTSFVCGCAEPLPPPAKAAARIDLSECGVAAGVSSVPKDGNVQRLLQNNVLDLEAFPYAVDGENGGEVSCSMAESSPGTIALSASVKMGATFFEVGGAVSGGFGTEATLTWFDSAKLTHAIRSSTCSLSVLQTSPSGDGALVSFDCLGMVNMSIPDLVCRGTGTFVLDRCEK